MSDEAFLAAFEATAIPVDEWHHRDHLRVAYLYLRADDFATALARIRAGIRALNSAHGTPETLTSGYHETLTVAWALRIAQALDAGDPGTFAAFLERHAELADRHGLRDSYSGERITTARAKREFVAPDKCALPSRPID